MDISTLNENIFSKNITPLNTYILIGDKEPELEIKTYYLEHLVNNGGNKSTNKYFTYRGNKPKIYNSQSSLNKKNDNIIINFDKSSKNSKKSKKSNNSDFNDSKNSLTNMSAKFLPLLYAQGEFNENNISFIQLTKEQMKKFNLQQNNPFIRSFHRLHPFSIFYGTKYDKLIKKAKELALPAPFYVAKNDWCKPEDTSPSGVFEGIKFVDEKGIVIDSPELKKKFSGLVLDIILQILRVPLGHHISLNIKIFQPDTVLSRYPKLFSYANVYLIPASEPKLTPYERFKFIIAFLFSGLYIGCKQLKPFNPFLGETFQGEFPNGAKIYVENVTHKPLVARFLIRYKKIYELNGYWELDVDTKSFGNEMTIIQKGPIRINFPELNESYVGHIPFVKAINARSEDERALLYFGSLICVDPKHNYKCWIEFNYNKSCFHEIRGCTMNYEFPKDYEFNADKEWYFGNEFKMDNDMKKNQKKTKMYDNYTIYENISGSFIHYLKIGNDIIWDINKNPPDPIKSVRYCIPSDGRFREDLNWLYRSFYNTNNEKEEEVYREIGMKWKVMMEEFNRWDRKRRNSYNESLKKKK